MRALMLGFRLFSAIKLPLLAIAILALATLGLTILNDARAHGFLKAESARLADIAVEANDNVELLKGNAETGAKLMSQHNKDKAAWAARESELLAKIEQWEVPDGENYCRPGCVSLEPVID